MAAFIFIIPIAWPIGSNMNLRDFQEMLFQYAAMILCTFFVGNIYMPLFMAWTVFLFYLNGSQVGQEAVLNVFLGIMLYGVSTKLFSRFKFDKEAVWIGRVGLVSLCFMLLQQFSIDPLHIKFNYEVGVQPAQDFCDKVGVMNLKAHNGILMALMAVVLTSINPIFGLIGIFPVWLSESSGAILAVTIGILFYLFHMKRKWFYPILGVATLAGCFYAYRDYKTDSQMYLSRFATWHLTVRQVLLRPIGYGPDSFRNVTPHKDFLIAGDQDRRSALGLQIPGETNKFAFIYYHPKPSVMFSEDYVTKRPLSPNVWDHPHNEILNLFFWWGFPGLILVGLFARECCKRFMLADKTKEIVLVTSLILVYVASSMVQFPLSVARLGYMFPLLLGAFTAATEKNA